MSELIRRRPRDFAGCCHRAVAEDEVQSDACIGGALKWQRSSTRWSACSTSNGRCGSTAHRLDFPTFALVYLRNQENDFEVELTVNKDRKEPYTHGDGYGHFAVCVDDVARERDRLAQFGFTPGDVKEFKDGAGALLARYFFVQDPDGYKIEVLEHNGHYR
jgi:lactoylglutathione lyase